MHYIIHYVYTVYYNNRIVHDASRAWDKTIIRCGRTCARLRSRIQDAYPVVDKMRKIENKSANRRRSRRFRIPTKRNVMKVVGTTV